MTEKWTSIWSKGTRVYKRVFGPACFSVVECACGAYVELDGDAASATCIKCGRRFVQTCDIEYLDEGDVTE